MTRKMRFCLLLTACVLASRPALAADLLTMPQPRLVGVGMVKDPTTYVALRGGASWAINSEVSTSAGAVATEYQKPGYFVSGAIGFHLDALLGEPSGLRAEVEAGMLETGVESHTIGHTTHSGNAAKGSKSSTFAVASLYYDFMPKARFTPFVGAGAGLAQVDFKDYAANGTPVIDDKTTNWTYHVTAGISARLTERWTGEIAYRALATPDAGPRNSEAGRQEIDVTDYLLTVGARAHF